MKITDTDRPLWSLRAETSALHEFLQERAQFQFNAHRDIADGETRASGGLAISPTQAAMCAWEVGRTAAFIRGITQAVQQLRQTRPDRPVQLLYAGCGPYALLAVPLMSLFSPNQLQFTLLDIHEQSITSAKSLVEGLGFTKHVVGYLHEDACHYDAAGRPQPDIIVSETMNVCLANEPLVTIACRLLSQCANAILVPRSVRVDACLVDESKEFAFVDPRPTGDLPVPDRDRVLLGTVFELTEENARRWGTSPRERLPAQPVTVPSPLEARYRPMLLTTVNVYGNVVLQDYDCSLTIPRPISASQPLKGGEVLQFEYRLGTDPQLVSNVVSEEPSGSG